MSKTTKPFIGATGLNTKTSKFLQDSREATVLENILVTSGTRKRRSNYTRWKYDKYCSNAIRCIGTYKKSFALIKDVDNLKYNGFAAAQSSTIEIKFRLPGVGGYSLKSTMYVASRQIHGIGYTFQLNFINTGSTAYNEYRAQLIVSDAAGTGTLDFTSTKFVHGKWYMLSIVKNESTTKYRALLDGVFVEEITFPAFHDGAVSAFGVTRDDNTYSDIVLGAKNDLTDFTPIDIAEFRLWNEARSDGNVLAYYDREVPTGTARTNMICYLNFSETHDGKMGFIEKINSNCAVFFGGQPAFKDANNYLVFDGSSQYGKLNPIGGILTLHYNLWGGGNGGELLEISEVAFKILKLKQCNIIGGLSMYYDSGNSKYGFRFRFVNSGANTTIDSGGMAVLADVDVTEYYVQIRAIYTGTPHIEIWVNGTLKNSANFAGTHGHPSGEPGQYAGANPTGTGAFSCIRLKWFRTSDAETDDAYFSTKYNQEVDEFKLIEYSHGVQDMDWVGNTPGSIMRRITGSGTNLTSLFNQGVGVPDWNQRYFALKEAKGSPGEEYQDGLKNLVGQAFEGFYANATPGPWANAGYPKITNKEGFFITNLLMRYNENSWKFIKTDKDSGIQVAMNNSFIAGTLDRDKDSGYKLELYYYVSAAAQKFNHSPSFIGGTQRLDVLLPCRYLTQYKNIANDIDVVISIIGTSFNVFNRTTKILTQYPINVLPNSNKAFSGDLLNDDLYITDGVTKLHVYGFKGELKVVRWGFERPQKQTSFTSYIGGGPWSGRFQYAYTEYNREIDQFGPLCFPKSDGSGQQQTLVTSRAIQINGLTPSNNFFEGVSDIAIFRTKDLDGSFGIVGHYWLLDFIRGNSQGVMDWSQSDSTLAQRYPIEISSSVDDMSPPPGEFLAVHNKRVWVGDKNNLRFSRIGSELHTGVVKSEAYLFPGDHSIPIQGNKDITGIASYYNKALFVFTNSSIDIITGVDQNDFEIRRIHEGIGCIANRSIFKYGDLIGWMGSDDIYVLRNGVPEPLDVKGRINDYIHNTLSHVSLSKCFAIVNKHNHLLEMHVIRTDGVPTVIYYDFKSDTFSIGKDLRATYACEVLDDNKFPEIFIGTSDGFIVKDSNSGGTYQPTSGSKKTTISSYDGAFTITVAASDLQITEGGLIGNTVYIVKKSGSNIGAVSKSVIISNTATTITFSVNEIEFIFAPFTPSNGDDVYIGPIFTRWKTPVIFITPQAQDTRLEALTSNSLPACELIDLAFIHNRGVNTNANSFFGLYRDGASAVSKIMQIKELDKDYTVVQIPDSSRAKFFEIEVYHLHESSECETIGFLMGLDITRDDYAGTN